MERDVTETENETEAERLVLWAGEPRYVLEEDYVTLLLAAKNIVCERCGGRETLGGPGPCPDCHGLMKILRANGYK